MEDTIRTKSGRRLDDLTMDALRANELSAEDFRISREQLTRQADAAQAAGNHQLAENLRRAAEMTEMSNQQVLEIYNLLRPGRATYDELITLANHLQNDQNMPLVASFIREAAEAYRQRGIIS